MMENEVLFRIGVRIAVSMPARPRPPNLKDTRPRFSASQAESLAHRLYGLQAKAKELPSERDQNFLLETEPGDKCVLKIANAAEDRAILELQNEALAHIARRDEGLPVPRVLSSREGRDIETVDDSFLVRMLTHLPGTPLASYRPHAPNLLKELGRMLGRLDRALESFDHPASDRYIHWDSRHARDVVGSALELAEASEKRPLLERSLERIAELPSVESLPTAVIHNDANDHNILVGRDGAIIGLLDFGDMVATAQIFELANACAYVMAPSAEPLATAARVVAGYHECRPLTDREIETIFPAILARLSMSVAISARQSSEEPERDYLTVSEEAAWNLLGRLDAVCPRLAHYQFRQACGIEAHPATVRLSDVAGGASFASVLPFDLREEPAYIFDLTVGSLEVRGRDVVDDFESFNAFVFDTLRAKGMKVGVGRYGEPRALYSTSGFRTESGEPRTVHLGIDLFVAPGTAVHAPLPGEVHSFRVNDAPLDYGPTIILEHCLDDVVFYTLYGHLSQSSLDKLAGGKPVARGEAFATVGEPPGNGGWPAHLHFQSSSICWIGKVTFRASHHRRFGSSGSASHPIPASFWGSPTALATSPPGRTRTSRRDVSVSSRRRSASPIESRCTSCRGAAHTSTTSTADPSSIWSTTWRMSGTRIREWSRRRRVRWPS